ncbi:hypothetical protein OZX61_12735 (plasmid) [Acinetobacter sp. ESL0695]|uniref:hypothetical protein n=1 Tax=Acinetobacter sp. ESL0695 TaxID=2983215 RepID=UPI0023F0A0C1|nr:hypothetical protein [Acinetobacter sp. ESL0695]WEV50259.1 hypothetical protein OZX61_12735 [Acinetobacter sp. ESL0695]
MIFKLTHNYTLLTDFFGIETNLHQDELEKILFYIEFINMEHIPNLPYVVDDSLSEKDVIELLPILYQDKSFTFKPIYQKPKKFITIDLWDIENSYRKFKPIISEINEKYAIPNASISLLKFYKSEAEAWLRTDEDTQRINRERELGIVQKILKGEEIKADWNLTSFMRKDLTGIKFIPSQEKEIIEIWK